MSKMQQSKHIVKLVFTNRFAKASVFPWALRDNLNEDSKPIARCSSQDFPEDAFPIKKMNKADEHACVMVAQKLSQKMQKKGVSVVKLAGAPKYHGRVRAFIEELRRNGINMG